ncbi:MAG: hypothetical protein ACRDUY_12600 [Nitriliruptorales bacterium]
MSALTGAGEPSDGFRASARHGHVAVVDGSVRVADWRTSSPEIVRWFEERLEADEDLAEALELAVRVGALALGRVEPTVNVDYVEKEFERLHRRLEQALEERIHRVERVFEQAFAEEDGHLAQALGDYLGEGGRLAELFDPNRRDSAISRMRELLGEHFDGESSKVAKLLDGESSKLAKLLDASNPEGPLASWQREMTEGFEGLRRLIGDYRTELREQAAAAEAATSARTEEREKGTHKGREYEETVFGAVNAIAAVFGDLAEPTGDQAAAGGSRKVGDVVVTLNERDTRGASVRLVVEAKDKSVRLTPMLRELGDAIDNRGAAGGIAVFSRAAHMPNGTAPFREQGTRYLCLLDKDSGEDLALQVAYRTARLAVIASLAGDDVTIDTKGIRDDLEAARHQLQTVATVKGQLTKLRNSLDAGVADVEERLEELRSGLVQILDRLDTRLHLDRD